MKLFLGALALAIVLPVNALTWALHVWFYRSPPILRCAMPRSAPNQAGPTGAGNPTTPVDPAPQQPPEPSPEPPDGSSENAPSS